ncbi:MAG TPA: SGNH/GDSL hydrolase family protein [Sphingomonas sp.]|nr:SGNH/GDSL hydrolase family protein [Sphingomonas sp.]
MRMIGIALAVLVSNAAIAQEAPKLDPVEERIHNDWAEMARYRPANAKLKPTPGHPRIVFIGDSITDWWRSGEPSFWTPGRIDRGIGGQTTPQMLVRFRQDVLDLHPDVVHIMGGTNDIGGNTGPMTLADTEANVRTMVELAQAHGIRVIIGSVPPADRFPWKPSVETGKTIVALNAWLKGYAARTGCVYADYWSALKGDGLGIRTGLSGDGVHPTTEGYKVMAPVAEAAIAQALSRPAPAPIPILR